MGSAGVRLASGRVVFSGCAQGKMDVNGQKKFLFSFYGSAIETVAIETERRQGNVYADWCAF